MSQQHLKLLFFCLGQPLAIHCLVLADRVFWGGGFVQTLFLYVASVASLHPLQPVLEPLISQSHLNPHTISWCSLSFIWFIETIGRLCVHGRMNDIYSEKRRSSLRVHPMDMVWMKAREALGTGV